MALTYGEISAITEKYYIPKLVDNIFTSNVLFNRSRQKFYSTYDGGTSIMEPVLYAQTSAGGSYSGSDTLDTTANDQITAAEFQMKQYYSNITITRSDELKNSGKAQIINFVKSKVQVAEMTLKQNLGSGIYSDGTDSDDLVGLRAAVDTDNTYGGIDRTSYSWWQAQQDSTTTALTLAAMQGTYGDCTVGNDKPSIIVTTQDIFDDLHALLTPSERFVDKNTAEAGFTNIMFKATPVIVDNTCPSQHMYFLNESYMKIYAHSKENFRFEPFQKPLNQNVSSAKIYWAGAFCINNPRMQGVMDALV